jgi:hypothetical protein
MFYWVVIIMSFFFVDIFATNVRCQLQASWYVFKFCFWGLVSCLLASFPFLNVKKSSSFCFHSSHHGRFHTLGKGG